MPNRHPKSLWFLLVLLLAMALMTGCAHHWPLPEEERLALYTPRTEAGGDEVLWRHAPLFVAHGSEKPYNRIGTPTAGYDNYGRERITIDPDKPTIYTQVRQFTTARGSYTNLIYRIHFAAIPFNLLPFNLTAGRNVGLMVVVTLDAAERPVLFTTVHTCGCYMAFTPTSHLPEAHYPDNWPEGVLKKYGERLPARLDLSGMESPRLLVSLRPEVHRVMDLRVVADGVPTAGDGYDLRPTALVPVAELERLPLNGRTTSLYHKEGFLKGHVKGSVKFWETLLLSWASLDLFVGTDKAYADPAETDNPFYTSLKPWNRDASNMWHFESFLEFWGWRL
ncbi:MAG: hypothetical protein QNJ22_11510 [Desulfosarcinaceae bacterium]|nr:hypothetical protein [Desulfosarcinaceae bacterium]